MSETTEHIVHARSKNGRFQEAALSLVANDYSHRHLVEEDEADPSDFYIVWFVKVLGNWKAMVSTDLEDGLYWEVTFNGNTGDAYVDEYRKHANTPYRLTIIDKVRRVLNYLPRMSGR